MIPGTASILNGPFQQGVSTVSVASAGTGYVVGDILILDGGECDPATFGVSSVDGSGGVTGVDIIYPGDCSETPPCTVGGDATLDPAAKNARATLSNENLTVTADATANSAPVKSTLYKSTGKWFFEATVNVASAINIIFVGVGTTATSLGDAGDGSDNNGYSYAGNSGVQYHNSTGTYSGATFGIGDVIGCALDLDGGTIKWYKNGALTGSGTYSGVSGSFTPMIVPLSSAQVTVNNGASSWAYAAPDGYIGWDGPCATPTTGGSGSGATLAVTFAQNIPAVWNRGRLITGLQIAGGLTASIEDEVSSNTNYNVSSDTLKTIGAGSSKLYFEVTVSQGSYIGFMSPTFNYSGDINIGSTSDSYAYRTTGYKVNNAVSTAYGTGVTVPATIGVKLDQATGEVSFVVEGVDLGVAFTATGSLLPAVTLPKSGTAVANFGASDWNTDPGAGYVGWYA